jgi:hypothetical protein
LDATKIHNLAGKYRMGYGTPFDLADLNDSTGIDLHHITHIRVSDAGGCLAPDFATYDSQGHKVNDPWPTPFDTGGFDLDAIGVIHNTLEGLCQDMYHLEAWCYPNPFNDFFMIVPGCGQKLSYQLLRTNGQHVKSGSVLKKEIVRTDDLQAGLYILKLTSDNGTTTSFKLIQIP